MNKGRAPSTMCSIFPRVELGVICLWWWQYDIKAFSIRRRFNHIIKICSCCLFCVCVPYIVFWVCMNFSFAYLPFMIYNVCVRSKYAIVFACCGIYHPSDASEPIAYGLFWCQCIDARRTNSACQEKSDMTTISPVIPITMPTRTIARQPMSGSQNATDIADQHFDDTSTTTLSSLKPIMMIMHCCLIQTAILLLIFLPPFLPLLAHTYSHFVYFACPSDFFLRAPNKQKNRNDSIEI